MFEVQYILTFAILIAAGGYGVVLAVRQVRSFAPRSRCGSDCGCKPAGK